MRDIIVVPTSHDGFPNLTSQRWLTNRGVQTCGELEDVRTGLAIRVAFCISLRIHSLRLCRVSRSCMFTIDGSQQCMRDRIQTVGQLVRKDRISASRMEKSTAAADCRGDGQARHGFTRV